MTIEWDKIEYFKPEDFDDPDYPGSWVKMTEATIIKINQLRTATGWPIVPHNKFGLHGCVAMKPGSHSNKSRHYVENGCDAIDWHFVTGTDPREQAIIVLGSGFRGIGIYYDWSWPAGVKLAIGFHTDMRPWPQVWKRENGEYIYLLK